MRQPDSTPTPSGLRRLFRRVSIAWNCLGISLLMLLLLESGLQLWGSFSAARDPREAADAYGASDWAGDYFLEFEATRSWHWQPFSYSRRDAYAGEYIRVNAQGLRETWLPSDLKDDAPELFCFGGSTVWGSGARDAATIPSQLSRLLHEQAGISVRCVNYGESGRCLSQELIELMTLLRDGARPRLVVFYDGWNEVHSAWLNQTGGRAMDDRRLAQMYPTLRDSLRLLPYTVKHLWQQSALSRWLPTAVFTGPKLDAAETSVLAGDCARSYLGSIRVLRALADSFGFRALFVLQPTLFQKPRQSPFEQAAYERRLNLEALCNETYAAIRAEANDPDFLDLSQVFADEPSALFIDHCHLAEEGNLRVAQALLSDVLSHLRD